MTDFIAKIGVQGPSGPPVKFGLLSERPAASAQNKGTHWYATDVDPTEAETISNGTTWLTVGGNGKVISVDAATTTTLPAYTVGGLGATLTATSNGAFPTVDSYAAALGNVYLVEDETGSNQVNNGVWTLTTLGSPTAAWVLTRSSKLAVGSRASGTYVPVRFGSQAGYTFLCDSPSSSDTVGTHNLTFSPSAGSTALQTVAHDSTLSGAGTSASNLVVSGTIVSGAAAGATALQTVTHDSTLTGSGTVASPLTVVNGGGAAVISTKLVGAAFGTSAAGTITFGVYNHIVVDTTGLSGPAVVQLDLTSTVSEGDTRRISSYSGSGQANGGVKIVSQGSDDIGLLGATQDIITAGQSVEYSAYKATAAWVRQTRTDGAIDVRDFGALGIGSTYDDWPAFEAAFAYARAQLGAYPGTIKLHVPRPPSYYWCTRRLRPGCRINMYGDGNDTTGYLMAGQIHGTAIKFVEGCPGLFLDSYNTAIMSTYAPPGLNRCDGTSISDISFYGSGTSSLPLIGATNAKWQASQNYTVNKYLKPSTAQDYTGSVDYAYMARVHTAGNSGTVEPTWPTDPTLFHDGKLLYDSGVGSPPPGALPSGGNGTCVYELQLAAGVRTNIGTIVFRDVTIVGFCGSGMLIMGSSGGPGDYGGHAINVLVENCNIFYHDRNAIQLSWTPTLGNGDTGSCTFTGLQAGACGRDTFLDQGDVGNTWINIHSEYDNPYYVTKRIIPLFTPSVVLGGYSEHFQPPFYGPQTMVIGCYDQAAANGAGTVDPTSSAFVMNVAHRCNYLLGWKSISTNLGVGLCLGQWGAVYGPVNQAGYNAAFTICMARLPGGGMDANAGTPNENYFFTYFDSSNYSGTQVLGSFYLHVSAGQFPAYSGNYGYGLTTTESSHGAGHFLIGTGAYFGYTTTVFPGYWYRHPTRSSKRYVAFDGSGYATDYADAGSRTLGDRTDTVSATINHMALQVTRAGLATSVWRSSTTYQVLSNVPSAPRVRPRDPASTQAWQMDTTFSSSGATGATEPTWPASPTINVTTVDDPNGQIRWIYRGTGAGHQPFGSVEGLRTFSVAGSSDVTLTESSENFLARCLILTGAITANINLILPTLLPSGSNNTPYPVEPYTRWVQNSTSGAFTLTVKTSAGTGIAIPQGEGAWVLFDGTNIVRMTSALTATAPADVTKAAAVVGTSINAARSDHKHDVSTAATSTIGSANSEGSATSLARSDHNHLISQIGVAGSATTIVAGTKQAARVVTGTTDTPGAGDTKVVFTHTTGCTVTLDDALPVGTTLDFWSRTNTGVHPLTPNNSKTVNGASSVNFDGSARRFIKVTKDEDGNWLAG